MRQHEFRPYLEAFLLDRMLTVSEGSENDSDAYDGVEPSFTASDLLRHYISASENSDVVELANAILFELAKQGVIDSVTDEFSGAYYFCTALTEEIISQRKQSVSDPIAKLNRVGNRFFESVLYRYVDEYDAPSFGIQQSTSKKEISEDTSDATLRKIEEGDGDSWAPLKIDRSDSIYVEMTSKVHRAIETVEADNGYAATCPEERDAIIASTKGQLEAIENGQPSREAILAGLAAPLKFLSQKFIGTLIGEAAKLAFASIVAWLRSLH